MTGPAKGAIIAAVDAALILALAWNASSDLQRWPKGWTDATVTRETAPGSQYLMLDLMVPARGVPEDTINGRCRLTVEDDLVVCRFDAAGGHWFARLNGPGSPPTFSRPYRYRAGDAAPAPSPGARVSAEVAVSPDGRLKVLRIAPVSAR